MGKIVRIVKHYGRKISHDWQSWDFSTTLEKTFDEKELDSKDKMLAESEKLFSQTKALTDLDIKKYEEEVQPKKSE